MAGNMVKSEISGKTIIFLYSRWVWADTLEPVSEVKTNIKGWLVVFRNNELVYEDTLELITKKRPCKRCGKMSTKKGYDPCLGYLPGVSSACCGHGLGGGHIIFNNGKKIEITNEQNI